MNFCHCQEAISANLFRSLYIYIYIYIFSLSSLSRALSCSLCHTISHCIHSFILCLFYFSHLFMLVSFGDGSLTKCWIQRKSFAVAIVIASLAGPQWLLTEEKIPNPNFNGTINYNNPDDGMYILKTTKSSLWILCFAQGNFAPFSFIVRPKRITHIMAQFSEIGTKQKDFSCIN